MSSSSHIIKVKISKSSQEIGFVIFSLFYAFAYIIISFIVLTKKNSCKDKVIIEKQEVLDIFHKYYSL